MQGVKGREGEAETRTEEEDQHDLNRRCPEAQLAVEEDIDGTVEMVHEQALGDQVGHVETRRSCPAEELQEELVVVVADAFVDIDAVVVHLEHASPTRAAVVHAVHFPHITSSTEAFPSVRFRLDGIKLVGLVQIQVPLLLPFNKRLVGEQTLRETRTEQHRHRMEEPDLDPRDVTDE